MLNQSYKRISIFLLIFFIGCSVTIEVTPDGSTIINAPNLQHCQGVEILLTLRQSTAKTITTKIEDDKIVFDSGELGDFDFSQTFSLELRIQRYDRNLFPDCAEFLPPYELFIANNKKFKEVGNGRYEISAGEFTRAK